MLKLSHYKQSRFYQRLKARDDDPEIVALMAHLGLLAEHAKFVLAQINRFLPQYTLHDEHHILNVISIMDALTPTSVMDRLTPLECALCLLAAYTHDLGMALADEEYQQIIGTKGLTPARKHYVAFRSGYVEEVQQIERLSSGDEEARRRADLIESHIRADYIRLTHVDEQIGRVTTWLNEIKSARVANNESLFTYAGYDFQEDLVNLSISHGCHVTWLRERLKSAWVPSDDDHFLRFLRHDEAVNLAFPGLLLRLADIMDFDATRTPRILFAHLGLDNTLSLNEWSKHLSITGWDFITHDSGPPQLVYAAHQCQHPVYEKVIRDFLASIEAEIEAVRAELRLQSRYLGLQGDRYDLFLPLKVDHRIAPAGSRDAPHIYIMNFGLR